MTDDATARESDFNLVKRVRNGDQTAFRELVDKYQRKVFGICFGMVRNRDDAMDLVQETFVKVFKSLDRFRGNSAFYTWVYRIATNVSIDFIRKHSRATMVDYDDAIKHDGEKADEAAVMPSRLGINPARVLGRKELLGKIQDALQNLSPAHRQVILLREVEGLAYQEIADTIGVSIGTVMSRLHHARKNMQADLAEYVGNTMNVDS